MTDQRPDRGRALRVLADRVRERLVSAVPEALQKAGISGQSYCLILNFGETLFPLTLIVGLESERRSIVANRGAEAKRYLYVPAGPAVLLDDPAGARDYSLLDEGIARNNAWRLGRSTLRQVARELGERDWSSILDPTDDFVVIALDYEADELAESLTESVSDKKVATLRARGMI